MGRDVRAMLGERRLEQPRTHPDVRARVPEDHHAACRGGRRIERTCRLIRLCELLARRIARVLERRGPPQDPRPGDGDVEQRDEADRQQPRASVGGRRRHARGLYGRPEIVNHDGAVHPTTIRRRQASASGTEATTKAMDNAK